MIALRQILLGAAAEPEAKARCIMVALENDAVALYSAGEEDKAALVRARGSKVFDGWFGVQDYSAALLITDETVFLRFFVSFVFFDNLHAGLPTAHMPTCPLPPQKAYANV